MKAQDIMHPEDAKAIRLIRSVPGCEGLVRKFMKLGYEAQYRGENLAGMIRVTSRTYPDIYAAFREVTGQVGIAEPELYVYNDPMMNAYTYGETRTFIALSNSLVERMSREELKGIIAHECGHILCRHTLYLTMYETLKEMGAFLGLIPWMMFSPLYLALQYWNRKSELSADRCGAVVVGEEIYQAALVKLASGMKEESGQPDCLVEQGKASEALKRSSLWNRIQQEYQWFGNKHRLGASFLCSRQFYPPCTITYLYRTSIFDCCFRQKGV